MWEQSTMAVFDDDESLQRRTRSQRPCTFWAVRGGNCPPRFLGIGLRSRMRLPRAILAKNGAALSVPFMFHDWRRSAVDHIGP